MNQLKCESCHQLCGKLFALDNCGWLVFLCAAMPSKEDNEVERCAMAVGSLRFFRECNMGLSLAVFI